MLYRIFWSVLLAFPVVGVSAQTTAIDQSNIHEAVALWLTNETEALATYGEMSQWDVSQVTDMSRLFSTELFMKLPDYDAEIPGIADFNEDLSGWDVGNVTNFYRMFFGASSFNQDLSQWNVSSATSLHMMFDSATDFNQSIGNWDVSNVTDMHRTFRLSGYNQDLSAWQTGQVRDMFGMFYNASFNQPIGNWDVSSATNMTFMFREAAFNQPLGDWDVSSVNRMTGMFQSSEFNQPIGNWEVSNVTIMEHMFQSSAFNQPIGTWDVSNVTRFKKMFYGCDAFDQDLSTWNVGSATSMIQMFYHADLVDMNFGGWNISNAADMGGMLTATNLSKENYDATLIGWAAQSVQPNVIFGSAGSWCSDEAGAARDVLLANGWSISDGGRDVTCLPAGCMDDAACNYDNAAEVDDNSCYYPDACGECDGPGLDLTGTVGSPLDSWHYENGYPWGHFGIDYALYEQYSQFMVDGATLILEMDGQTVTCELDGGGFGQGDGGTDYWFLIASDPTYTGGAFLYESFGQNLMVGATWTLPDVFCGCDQAVEDECGECGGPGLNLAGTVGAWNDFHAENGYSGNFFGIESANANAFPDLFHPWGGYAITIESAAGVTATFPIQYLGGPQQYDWRYVYITVDGDPYGSLASYFPDGVQPGDTWYITDAFCDCGQTIAQTGYTCDGICIADSDADGTCDPFDQCSDVTACNYNDQSNAACTYPDACGNCGGNSSDSDGDGICDQLDECSDSTACNFDDPANEACDFSGALWYLPASAGNTAGPALFTCQPPSGYTEAESQDCMEWLVEVDAYCLVAWDAICADEYQLCVDGCTFIQIYPDPVECLDVFGCMDEFACNYDDAVNIEDDSCTYPGCTNADACNYDAAAGCDDGSCEFAAPLIYSDFEHTAGGNGNGNGNSGGNGNGNSGGSNGYNNGYGTSTVFWSIWNDGGSDCRLSGADAAYATSGTRCVRLRDNSASSVVYTDALAFSAFTQLTVTFNFEAASMEAGESFHLEYSTDGGDSYTTAATYVSGADFVNGTSYIGWNENISAEFTDETRLRFRCDASNNNDYIYLDDIYINGCEGEPDNRSFEATPDDLSDGTPMMWGKLYPNPAQDVLTIEWMGVEEAQMVELAVLDMAGRMVLQRQFNGEDPQQIRIEVNGIQSGLYLVALTSNGQRWTESVVIE